MKDEQDKWQPMGFWALIVAVGVIAYFSGAPMEWIPNSPIRKDFIRIKTPEGTNSNPSEQHS
ncbi:MAG: hypothetical protein WDM96_04910 [Lacunisphaera sp.]